MIGTVNCPEIAGRAFVSKTKILCEVPPLPIGTYPVTVLISGTTTTVTSVCAGTDWCKLDITETGTPIIDYLLPVDVIPWTVINFRGKFRIRDETLVRFKIGNNNWCNSTDLMVPWTRTLSPNSW